MDNIYEWLYDHYFKLRQGEILVSYRELAPALQQAEERILSGGGDQLDREDALALYRHAAGVTAFAAGVRFGSRLAADLDFLED